MIEIRGFPVGTPRCGKALSAWSRWLAVVLVVLGSVSGLPALGQLRATAGESRPHTIEGSVYPGFGAGQVESSTPAENAIPDGSIAAPPLAEFSTSPLVGPALGWIAFGGSSLSSPQRRTPAERPQGATLIAASLFAARPGAGEFARSLIPVALLVAIGLRWARPLRAPPAPAASASLL
jgi:hypothetical protein